MSSTQAAAQALAFQNMFSSIPIQGANPQAGALMGQQAGGAFAPNAAGFMGFDMNAQMPAYNPYLYGFPQAAQSMTA